MRIMKNAGIDKWLHALVCMVIVALVALVMKGAEPELANWSCGLLGFAVAMSAGFGKEVWDEVVRKTGFDWADIVADAAGAALGVCFTLMM